MSIEGQPVLNTLSGASPIFITRVLASSEATICISANFVLACLTFSSIFPVTSPPCKWTKAIF